MTSSMCLLELDRCPVKCVLHTLLTYVFEIGSWMKTLRIILGVYINLPVGRRGCNLHIAKNLIVISNTLGNLLSFLRFICKWDKSRFLLGLGKYSMKWVLYTFSFWFVLLWLYHPSYYQQDEPRVLWQPSSQQMFFVYFELIMKWNIILRI